MESKSSRWMIMGGMAALAIGIFLVWLYLSSLPAPPSQQTPLASDKDGQGVRHDHGLDMDMVEAVSKELKLNDHVVKKILATINENKNTWRAPNATFEELAATYHDLLDRMSRYGKDDPWARQVAEHLEQGNLEDARSLIMAAVENDEKTIENPGKETARKFFELAEISELTLDDKTAIERWQRALELLPGDISAWRNLARAHQRMGNGKLALLAWQYMYIHSQDQGDISNQAISLSGEAGLLARDGHIDPALSKYLLARQLFDVLAQEDPKNIQWQQHISVAFHRIGDMHKAGGNGANAIVAYGDGLKIFQDLARKDPKNPQWQRGISTSHNKIGETLQANGELEKAISAYESGLKIRKRLVRENPGNPQWQRDLSVSHNKMGNSYKARGDVKKAMAAYGNSLKIFQGLARQDPENTQWQRELSVSHNKMGDIHKSIGEADKAIESYEKGLEIRRVIARENPGRSQYQTDLAVSFYKLSTLLPDLRRQYLTDALTIFLKEQSENRLAIKYQLWIKIIQNRLALENESPE